MLSMQEICTINSQLMRNDCTINIKPIQTVLWGLVFGETSPFSIT